MTTELEGGEWSAARPGRTLPPGRTGYPLYRGWVGPMAGLDGGKSLPTGIRSLDRPAHSQSLYRLRYPSHKPGKYCSYFKVWIALLQLKMPVGNKTIMPYCCVFWIHRTDSSSVHHVFSSPHALFPRYCLITWQHNWHTVPWLSIRLICSNIWSTNKNNKKT